jgi:hypothetical protein
MPVVELRDDVVELRPLAGDWASAWANQTAGRSGQNGGRRTATLYTAAPSASAEGSVMLLSLDHVEVTNVGSMPQSNVYSKREIVGP